MRFLLILTLVSAFPASAQFTCSADVPYVPFVRGEGIAEHVGDIVLTCTGGTPTPLGQPLPKVDFQLVLNTNLTSRVFDAASASEALLLINDPAPGSQLLCPASTTCSLTAGVAPRYNVFQGVQSGAGSVRFSGVPINPPGPGAAVTIRFANIRANMTPFTATSPDTPPVNVTGTVTASGPSAPIISSAPQVLGFLFAGLTASVSPAAPFQQCASATQQRAFTVSVQENYSTSLMPRVSSDAVMQSSPHEINSTESMLTLNSAVAPGNIGAADFGTRFKLTFSSVPSGATLFVPVSIASPSTGGTAVLTATETGPFSPVPSSGSGLTAITGGTAIYEVTVVNPFLNENFQIPVYVSYTSPGTGVASVSVGYAPAVGVTVPRFSGISTSFSAFEIDACATSSLTVSPASLGFTFLAGNTPAAQSIHVASTGANRAFTASSTVSWLAVSPTSGTTPADLAVTVSPSLGAGSYSGSIVIGSLTVPVSAVVAASGCVYTLTPATQAFLAAGGTGSFTVATNAGCPWTPASGAAFIVVTAGGPGNGNGSVSFSVAANTGAARSGTIVLAGQTFTVTQAGTAAMGGPTAVVHDIFGGMRLTTFGSNALQNSGGVFGSDPGVARKPNGDTVAVARDNSNGIWINTFSAASQTWAGWTFAGGILPGNPAVTVTPDGTAWFAGRDSYGAYFLNSYSGGTFGGWQALHGVFGADPSLAATADGSVYVIARDNYNGMWSGRYIPGSGFQGWYFGGGITPGKPSAAAGSDNAVYVAMLDPSNAIWMNRVQGNTWGTWQPGHGVMATDPQTASSGTVIYAAAVDASGGVWYNTFPTGTANNWTGWTPVHGIMQSVSAAVSGSHLYLVAREASGGLWWQDTTGGGWMSIGYIGLTVGQPGAGPK